MLPSSLEQHQQSTRKAAAVTSSTKCGLFGHSLIRMLLLLVSFGLIAMLRESQSLRGLQAVIYGGTADEQEDTHHDSTRPYPIAWLLSYPNSGTSYTMTLVERASNLSTASNYGTEVTHPKGTSLALPEYPSDRGPYWEGLDGAARMNRTVRELPDPYSAFVLTKTHCGSRCIYCGPSDYLTDASGFLQDCLRTSRLDHGHRRESHMRQQSVARLVHLIRNPLHNVVARYHLDRRHFVLKNKHMAESFPNNAIGFQKWCGELDQEYRKDDLKTFKRDKQLLELFQSVPCHGEFFKYTQWHNLVLDMQPLLHHPPLLTVFYEDYQYQFTHNVVSLMQFVQQPYNASRLREFRALPTYQDYYTSEQIEAVWKLIQYVARPDIRDMMRRYFESDETEVVTSE